MNKQANDAARLAGVATVGSGAAVTAAAASACCSGPLIAPLLVSFLGAGGAAWAAGFKPYAPYALAGSLVMLLYAFRSAYRRPDTCALDNNRDTFTGPPTWLRILLWSGAAVWMVSLAVNILLASP
jgi:hypothetical protein